MIRMDVVFVFMELMVSWREIVLVMDCDLISELVC